MSERTELIWRSCHEGPLKAGSDPLAQDDGATTFNTLQS